MRNKTCKHCGTRYEPSKIGSTNISNPFCGIKCSREHERLKKARKNEKLKEKKLKAKEKKNNSLPVLRKKADALWSKAVRLHGKCEYCGTTEHLNAHHIFSRTNNATRWDIENGICLCAGHHTFSNEFSAHKTPCEFTIWFIDKFGQERFDRIRKKAKEIHNADTDFIKSEIESLEKSFLYI